MGWDIELGRISLDDWKENCKFFKLTTYWCWEGWLTSRTGPCLNVWLDAIGKRWKDNMIESAKNNLKFLHEASAWTLFACSTPQLIHHPKTPRCFWQSAIEQCFSPIRFLSLSFFNLRWSEGIHEWLEAVSCNRLCRTLEIRQRFRSLILVRSFSRSSAARFFRSSVSAISNDWLFAFLSSKLALSSKLSAC